MAARESNKNSSDKKKQEYEMELELEAALMEGKTQAEALESIGKTGDAFATLLCSKTALLLEKKRAERLKRFGSVDHLKPGWTKADGFAEEWAKKARPTPNVQWHIERNGSLEQRLAAPLPASREQPLKMAPPPMDLSSRYQRRPFGKPKYFNSTWTNPEVASIYDNDDASSVWSASTSQLNSSASVYSESPVLYKHRHWRLDRVGQASVDEASSYETTGIN